MANSSSSCSKCSPEKDWYVNIYLSVKHDIEKIFLNPFIAKKIKLMTTFQELFIIYQQLVLCRYFEYLSILQSNYYCIGNVVLENDISYALST